MDIKELDKKQLILLTLLITFVVSIATGIVTVSLMNQMPKTVPQTINNVIQRTIEKVKTVEIPATNSGEVSTSSTSSSSPSVSMGDGDTLVHIYVKDANISNITNADGSTSVSTENSIGSGVIISDVGLILVDSSILTGDDMYKVVLAKTDFNASVLKKFGNGFTILKISQIKNGDDSKEGATTSPVKQ